MDWCIIPVLAIFQVWAIHGFLFLFLIKSLCIFRERVKKGRKGEKHQCVVASCVLPNGDLACNPGICPHWESNLGPFGSQAGTQSTEPHKPGLDFSSFAPPSPYCSLSIPFHLKKWIVNFYSIELYAWHL